MANGRILGIKKSIILRALALLFPLIFIAYVFVCVYVIKIPSLWFFGFCILIGGFELVKGFLFKFDSCLYLGSLLCGIGSVGHVFLLTGTSTYAGYYIALAFILASVITYVFAGQRFHLVLAFSIFFVTLYCLLLTKNLINISILFAFLVPFLILLFVEILVACFHKK